MMKRLLAVAFIFICTSAAWGVLGGTIVGRTNSSSDRLLSRVQSLWGIAQTQRAPFGEYFAAGPNEGTKQGSHLISPSSSDVAVNLNLEYRQKGLLWYSTYKVGFQGDYEFKNPDSSIRTVYLTLILPAQQAIYDDLQFAVDGRAAEPVIEAEKASVHIDLEPQQAVKLHVGYRSQGLDSWSYSFGEKVNPVQNFHLRMNTDFRDIDFPDNTLSPTEKREAGTGWQLNWTFKNLLSGYRIAMTMPAKLQPGPLASEISFFAPVSLFFFFFVIFILTTTRDIELHPMNYFFLAAAFFAFHLLLAYLVDHLNIYWSFTIASVVSVLLVTSYLRIVVGERFALREAALAQVTYLVLFSFAFFFRGYTGLSITIGAILTLFLVMQMTGKIRWAEKFGSNGARGAPPPVPVSN
jgi:inner membrane protein involved in colicin E2 resistance